MGSPEEGASLLRPMTTGAGKGDGLRRILIIPERCLGCEACEIACGLVRSGSSSVVEAKGKGSLGATGVRVHSGIQRRNTVRGPIGSGKSPRAYPIRCHQCEDPKCVFACAAGALEKGGDGVIRVDEGQCTGCGICVMVCQYGAILVDRDRKVAVKCELCMDQAIPACVLACRTDALVLEENDD
jgi:carbon-monoxide dehydrogenase iron sulfur subunit